MSELIPRIEKMEHNFETLEHRMLENAEETRTNIEGIKNDILELQDKDKAHEELLNTVETKIDEAIKELKVQSQESKQVF